MSNHDHTLPPPQNLISPRSACPSARRPSRVGRHRRVRWTTVCLVGVLTTFGLFIIMPYSVTSQAATSSQPAATPSSARASPSLPSSSSATGLGPSQTQTQSPPLQTEPSISRCQSVIQPLISNPCMAQLGSGFAEMDNAEVEDQYLNVLANVVQTLCSDVCSAVFSSSAKAIVDNCWAELSIVVGRPLLPDTSRQEYEAQKAASLESILFSRDLMCNRNPNVQSQLCALGAIELDRKHKITSGGFYVEDEDEDEDEEVGEEDEGMAILAQRPPADPSNNPDSEAAFILDQELYDYDPESDTAGDPNSPTAQKYRLLGVLYGVELAPSLVTLPEVNMSAWSQMPRAEACTACLSMQLEQSSTFIATRAKTANKGTHLSPEMQDVCRRVAQIVRAVNSKCGQEWVRTPVDLMTLGGGAGWAAGGGGRVQGNGLADDGMGGMSSARAIGVSPAAWIVSLVLVGIGLAEQG